MASRRVATACALLLAGATTPLCAAESSGEQDSWSYGKLQGALALSGDGHWRVHVDVHHVLHRVNLLDPTQSATLALPVGVQALAASRTARKVALVTTGGCIGLADFGAGASPVARITWRPLPSPPAGVVDTAPARRDTATPPWFDEAPPGCENKDGFDGTAVIALSGDGRLLATDSEVVDLEARRIVATRGRAVGEYALFARFVDADTRLLTVDGLFGDQVGPGSVPSRLEAATWDLKTGALLSLSDRHGLLGTPTAQLAALAAGTATLYGAVEPLQGDPSGKRVPATLTSWRADACAPASVRTLAPTDWRNMAVDPQGRWIAGTRLLQTALRTPEMVAGFTDELVVLDLASGRQVARSAWKHALAGLVASSDGTHLYALAAASPVSQQALDPALYLGDVVDIALPAQAVKTAPGRPAAWPATPCLLDRENASARAVVHVDRRLQPLWTTPLTAAETSRSSCVSGICALPFIRRDGTPWLDLGDTVVAVDGATGRRLRSLATPRSAKVQSVPVGASDGFFNAQGDTLSWRPIDAAEPGAPARRIVDRRPGWEVGLLERQGDAALAAWVRKDAPAMDSPEGGGAPRPHVYAFYDRQGRKVSERTGTEDWDGDGWPTSDELQHELIVANAEPCHDETGALTTGFDWRIGPFNSIVAWACGPEAGVARIALWSDIDVRPKSGSATAAANVRRIVAQDGAVAVVEEAGRYRVFDAARSLELGQIELPPGAQSVAVVVTARRGLVLLQTAWDTDAPARDRLRAYSLN